MTQPDDVLGWRDPPPRPAQTPGGGPPVPEPADTGLSAALRKNKGQWALIGQNITWGDEHDQLVADLNQRPGFEHTIAPVTNHADGSLNIVDVYARFAGAYDASPWSSTGTVLTHSGTQVVVTTGGETLRVPYLDSYVPRPGDQVYLTGAGSERIVIGRTSALVTPSAARNERI